MQHNAANIYTSMQKDGLTGRELEAQILTRAAGLLRECQNHWGEEGNEDRLAAAVRFNQKIWTFFQAELTDPENPLPKEIKENLLNLSIFIDGRLYEFLLIPDKDKLTSIININLNIAAGLSEKKSSPSGTDTSPPHSTNLTVAA